MNLQNLGARFPAKLFFCVTANLCGSALLSLGQTVLLAQTEAQPEPSQSVLSHSSVEEVMAKATPAAAEEAPKIPNDQLDSLVAPIALYPDPLLAQTLAASTYPLEIIQLQQWLQKNKSLKGNALADAVAKQKWDPSVQSMAGVPDAVTRLAGNIQWTTDLGNAFLAQQSDVMDAVQRMRAKAESKGALKTSKQQKVETQTVEGGKQVIVIQQPSPDIVYVPSYDPEVVYGPPVYPYYPYTYPGYIPGTGLAFGAGIIAGGIWANNNWGNCNWGGGDININNNNNFNRNVNRNTNVNRGQGGSGKWQHNAQHRGNAPYGDRGTANKFGGNARQQPGGAGNRPGGGAGAGIANRPGGGGAGAANRPGGGAGAGANRPGGGGAGVANRPSGGAGAGGARPSTRPSGGGANSIGSRDVGGGSRGGNSASFSSSSRGGGNSPSFSSSSRGGGGGFGGGGGGSSARASSSRGGHSMGGGGMSRGGGGGGGGRGGGGGGRRR